MKRDLMYDPVISETEQLGGVCVQTFRRLLKSIWKSLGNYLGAITLLLTYLEGSGDYPSALGRSGSVVRTRLDCF